MGMILDSFGAARLSGLSLEVAPSATGSWGTLLNLWLNCRRKMASTAKICAAMSRPDLLVLKASATSGSGCGGLYFAAPDGWCPCA